MSRWPSRMCRFVWRDGTDDYMEVPDSYPYWVRAIPTGTKFDWANDKFLSAPIKTVTFSRRIFSDGSHEFHQEGDAPKNPTVEELQRDQDAREKAYVEKVLSNLLRLCGWGPPNEPSQTVVDYYTKVLERYHSLYTRCLISCMSPEATATTIRDHLWEDSF